MRQRSDSGHSSLGEDVATVVGDPDCGSPAAARYQQPCCGVARDDVEHNEKRTKLEQRPTLSSPPFVSERAAITTGLTFPTNHLCLHRKAGRCNAPQMKLEAGDAFEKENADWLREKLPTYEKLWSEFIGNDGTAHPLEIENLAEDLKSARRQFYQAHYSMALSARRFDSLLEELDELAAAEATVPGIQEQFELLFHLMAKLGHVRDMIAKMDTSLGMKGSAANRMQEFYDKRSHVMHGPQIPFDVGMESSSSPESRVETRNLRNGLHMGSGSR